MDLFAVPTASLRLLYGFFVIEHGRRHIVHFNATFHPTAAWVIQQLREAFPYDTAPRYLVFERNSIFNPAVVEFIKAMGTKPVRISFRSTWQNGTAERWIGSCRRELLAHVVVFGERRFRVANVAWPKAVTVLCFPIIKSAADVTAAVSRGQSTSLSSSSGHIEPAVPAPTNNDERHPVH